MIPLLFMALFSWSTLLSSAMQRYSNQSCNKRRHSDVSGYMRNVVPMSHRFVIWINPEKKKEKPTSLITGLFLSQAKLCSVQSSLTSQVNLLKQSCHQMLQTHSV